MPAPCIAMPRASRLALAVAMALLPLCPALAADPALPSTPEVASPPAPPEAVTALLAQDDITNLTAVHVRGLQPTSLPTRIPTTMEGITGAEIREQVNATDAPDALKYLPSLLVRKRYIGDYDHAVLATRASGTGNSARSLVYADGVLLSNLLGNGASFTPRWGMVGPEEIERVDVLYGPFSAAYSGNSVGAVVDYVTRMPARFEAHASASYAVEDFDLYGTHDTFPATTWSASLGHRWDRFSARIAFNRLHSDAHPISYATAVASTGVPGAGTPVQGAFTGSNPRNEPWYLLGASGQTDTTQAQARLKLAYDVAPDLRLSYVFGAWDNDAFRDSQSYLRDEAGRPVYSGDVQIDGLRYTIAPTAIPLQRAHLAHRLHGLSLKRSSGGTFDYTLSASRYRYQDDRIRSPTVARPLADTGGAGRIADSDGTGWTTATAALTWRPTAAHVVEVGAQRDAFELDARVWATDDWLHGAPQARVSSFGGRTALSSGYLQDSWQMSERWSGVLGVRLEDWDAHDGRIANATDEVRFADRHERTASPKAAVSFAPSPDWSLKASIGRAVRFPTVSELYQGSLVAGEVVNHDPGLKPERSVTSELSWVSAYGPARLRATVFHERTRDALYSQTDVTAVPRVTRIQNVGAIRTTGLELAAQATGVGGQDLDINGSVTFADSIIRENEAFPASVGQWQPRVPRWRANLLATWRPTDHWSLTGGLRYSGKQYNTLDNVDSNGDAYTGTGTFLVADLRVRYAHDAHWSAAMGVDNLGDRTYWNFHPYSQRTWLAELHYDY